MDSVSFVVVAISPVWWVHLVGGGGGGELICRGGPYFLLNAGLKICVFNLLVYYVIIIN